MKTSRVPLALLGLLYIGFFCFVAVSIPQLPATVATHFGGSGRPNGWMSQRGYAIFTIVFALVMPGIIVGTCALARLSKRTANTAGCGPDLFPYGLWFACLIVAFLAGVHWLIIEANRQSPPHLSMPAIMSLMVCFLAGMGLWVIRVVRRFRYVT